jgi:oxysterol-binding protein-related protein 9/10/11
MANSMVSYDTVIDDDAPGPPISVPDSGDTGEGRLKMIIQLLKRSLGVKDLAAMFVSFSYKQGYLTLNSLTI